MVKTVKKTISLIAAVDRHLAIGKGNDLPWRISEDLQYFKKTTLGKPIVMGRKTFESFGAKPLPGRLNVVITRNQTSVEPQEGVAVVTSLDEALDRAEQETGDEIMIIGGGQIYALALPLADKLYLTHVKTSVDGADVFFPAYNKDHWHDVSSTPSSNDDYEWVWQILEKNLT